MVGPAVSVTFHEFIDLDQKILNEQVEDTSIFQISYQVISLISFCNSVSHSVQHFEMLFKRGSAYGGWGWDLKLAQSM